MTEALKKLLEDNKDLLKEVEEMESALANEKATAQLVQEKLATAIATRDKAKNENTLFRAKLGVDNSQEINDEFLETIGAKKTADVDKLEKTWMEKVQAEAQAKQEIEEKLSQKIKQLAMDMAIREATEGQGVTDNPILAKAFRDELHANAIEKDGQIIYMGDNDIPIMVDGRPMSVSDKIAQMKSDSTYDVFFEKTVASGTGGTGGEGGNIPLRKSNMSDEQKIEFIKEHSAEDFHNLED